MRSSLFTTVLITTIVQAQVPDVAIHELALGDSVRSQFPVDLGGGHTCYAFQHMFGWDSSNVELMWTAPDGSVTNATAFHLPYPITEIADAANLDDGLLVGGDVSGEPHMATLVKVDDAGNLQWHKHITNVYHQQSGVGAIMPRGTEFSAYIYCSGISDGAYRVDAASSGTAWAGIEMLPPSTIRFSLNGAVATADPAEHLLFGMGLDFTDLANFKTVLIDVRDTGATWMKMYTMPPEFSFPNNALDLRRTADGNYICSGSFSPGWPVDKGYMMKVDPSGDVLWCRTYADTSGVLHLKSVIELPGGDLLVAGEDKYYQCLLLRLAPTGEIVWQRRSQLPGSVWHPVGKFLVNDVGERELGMQGRMVGLTEDGEGCSFVANATITDSIFTPAVTSVVLSNVPFTPLLDTLPLQLRTPALVWEQTCLYDAIEGTAQPTVTLRAFPVPTWDRVRLEGVNDPTERIIVRSITGSVIYDGPYHTAVDLTAAAAGVYTIVLPRTGQHALAVRQ